MDVNRSSGAIVDAALSLHTALGPGLLESVYQATLAHELRLRGRLVRERVAIPITYKGVRLEAGYYADLIVDDSVVVEIKAVAKLSVVHSAQLLSYLRLGGHALGLLINFHEFHLKNGIKRVINDR